MQSISRIILSALLASSWSALASANPNLNPEPSPVIDFGRVTDATGELDLALERLVARETTALWHEPSGPTHMSCRQPALADDLETCTVTASPSAPLPPAPAAPAALAAH